MTDLTGYVRLVGASAAIFLAATAVAFLGGAAGDALLFAASGAAFVVAFLALQRAGFSFAWRGHRHRLVLDEVAIYLGFVVLASATVVLLLPVAAAVEQMMVRRERVKAVFNVAQNVVAGGFAWLAFGAAAAFGAAPIVAAVPAAFAYTVTSNFLLAGVFARLSERDHLELFRERFLVDAILAGSVGAAAGVAIVAFWSLHPVTLLALLPFVYLTHRYGVLTALADRELDVRKRLAEVGGELVGTADVERAADRILDVTLDVLPSCGRAEIGLETRDGWRTFSRETRGGPATRAAPAEESVPGRAGRLGVLRAWPGHSTPGFADAERELLRIVAAQAGAAIEGTRALAASESARHRLDAYLRNAGDAVLLVDADGAVRFANPAAESLFGVRSGDGTPVDRLFPAWGSVARAPGIVETQAANAAGDRVMLVEAHAATLPAADGGGVLMVVRDVTERRRLEDETARQREVMARQEKLSAIGTLVAGVAHEINNPVVYMRGAAELARLDLDELAASPDAQVAAAAARAGKAMARLAQGVDRVETITRSLKAVARQGNGERRRESLDAVVRDVVEVLGVALPKGVALDVDVREAGDVVGNAAELHQVVLNLVKNATEAIATTGAGSTVRVVSRREGAFAVVLVADDGPGIPADVQKRLFEPFFTTKATGTGLGLGISKGIVEAHGGTLTVESAPGRGTTFTMRLPAA